MDNSDSRLIDVFFYGLYMSPELLRQKNVTPRDPRTAKAMGYRLRIGNLATLLRDRSSSAVGVVYSITHEELYSLYWGSGLNAYVSEALTVRLENGNQIPVLCCNLLMPPEKEEYNEDYHHKLAECFEMLGLGVIQSGKHTCN